MTAKDLKSGERFFLKNDYRVWERAEGEAKIEDGVEKIPVKVYLGFIYEIGARSMLPADDTVMVTTTNYIRLN